MTLRYCQMTSSIIDYRIVMERWVKLKYVYVALMHSEGMPLITLGSITNLQL